MKNNKLTLGVCAVLLLASNLVAAEDYPAADFQPQVLFHATESTSTSTSTSNSTAAAKPETAATEYPAANFEPKVLFNDPSYKASTSEAESSKAPAPQASPSTKTTSSVAVSPNSSITVKEESNDLALFAVIGLALAGGFVLYRKKSAAPAPTTTAGRAGELSGVARYIQAREPSPLSGVAKYIAKQTEAENAAAPTNLTKVETYLRNRG